MNRPISVDRKTKIALSFFHIIPIIPVKKAKIPQAAAKSIGIVSVRLLKKNSPPLSPERTNTSNNMKNKEKKAIKLIDILPNLVLGRNLILIHFHPTKKPPLWRFFDILSRV